MKFRIASDELIKAISRASSLPGAKLLATCPVSIEAGFEGIKLVRTSPVANLETEAEAEVISADPILLDFGSLEKVVSRMPKEQVVECHRGTLKEFHLRWGNATARLSILDPSEVTGVHRPPKLEVTYKKRLPTEDLMSAFEIAAPAASKSEVDTRLCGVAFVNMLGGLAFFGTDGRRLHCFISKGETEPLNILLPTEAAMTALKFLEENYQVSTLEVGENALRISSGSTVFTSALAKAEPMPWKEEYFDPESANVVTLRRDLFLSALRSVTPAGYGDLCRIGLEFTSDSIRLFADSQQGLQIEQRLAATEPPQGKPTEIFFNGQFMIALIEAATLEEITLKYIPTPMNVLFLTEPDRILALSLMAPHKINAGGAK